MEREEGTITYDEAIDFAGGFGPYQLILIVSGMMVIGHSIQVVYNFEFLTAHQEMLCGFDDQLSITSLDRI